LPVPSNFPIANYLQSLFTGHNNYTPTGTAPIMPLGIPSPYGSLPTKEQMGGTFPPGTQQAPQPPRRPAWIDQQAEQEQQMQALAQAIPQALQAAQGSLSAPDTSAIQLPTKPQQQETPMVPASPFDTSSPNSLVSKIFGPHSDNSPPLVPASSLLGRLAHLFY
jgi:hypothetical protein